MTLHPGSVGRDRQRPWRHRAVGRTQDGAGHDEQLAGRLQGVADPLDPTVLRLREALARLRAEDDHPLIADDDEPLAVTRPDQPPQLEPRIRDVVDAARRIEQCRGVAQPHRLEALAGEPRLGIRHPAEERTQRGLDQSPRLARIQEGRQTRERFAETTVGAGDAGPREGLRCRTRPRLALGPQPAQTRDAEHRDHHEGDRPDRQPHLSCAPAISPPEIVEGQAEQAGRELAAHPPEPFPAKIRRPRLVRLPRRLSIRADLHLERRREALAIGVPGVRLPVGDDRQDAGVHARLEVPDLRVDPVRPGSRRRADDDQGLGIVERALQRRAEALARAHLVVVTEEASERTVGADPGLDPFRHAVALERAVQAPGGGPIALAVADEGPVALARLFHRVALRRHSWRSEPGPRVSRSPRPVPAPVSSRAATRRRGGRRARAGRSVEATARAKPLRRPGTGPRPPHPARRRRAR